MKDQISNKKKIYSTESIRKNKSPFSNMPSNSSSINSSEKN